MGLSPRGRGNRLHLRRIRAHVGSIPAWAGEPTGPTSKACAFRVYPRVGGGTSICKMPSDSGKGLSPRGRGNPQGSQTGPRPFWSIPAWAGEPPPDRVAVCPPGVYPRVGGGTCARCRHRTPWRGLSPRGRGNPRDRPKMRGQFGSIPAWAGEPVRDRPAVLLPWVYPRVGGGTNSDARDFMLSIGLSPRGRGNHELIRHTLRDVGSIPAWAGEPIARTAGPGPRKVYPRVGGGTLDVLDHDDVLSGLSPRGRGNLGCPPVVRFAAGSIPAWAGEPRPSRRLLDRYRVYPRVGGGTHPP